MMQIFFYIFFHHFCSTHKPLKAMFKHKAKTVHQKRIYTISIAERAFQVLMALLAGFGLSQAFAGDNPVFSILLIALAAISQYIKDFSITVYYEYAVEKELHEYRISQGQSAKPYQKTYTPYIYIGVYAILSVMDFVAGSYGMYRTVLHLQGSKVIKIEKSQQIAIDSINSILSNELSQIEKDKQLYYNSANWKNKLDNAGQEHIRLLDMQKDRIKSKYEKEISFYKDKNKEKIEKEKGYEEICMSIFFSIFFEFALFFCIKLKYIEVFNEKISKVKNWNRNKKQKNETLNEIKVQSYESTLVDLQGAPIGFQIKGERRCIGCGCNIDDKKSNATFCNPKCRKKKNKY